METRVYQTYSVKDITGFYSLQQFCTQALTWAESQDCFHYFTDNQLGSQYPHGGFRNMLAVGAKERIPLQKDQVFSDMQKYLMTEKNDWIIGFWGYDLKNEIEELQSHNSNPFTLPDAFFYIPEILIFFEDDTITIASFDNLNQVLQTILSTPIAQNSGLSFKGDIQQRTPKEKYLATVEQLREHILDGDIYEINYCMEFFSENAVLQPLQAYQALNTLSPMPFSVYGKVDTHYLLCASPERFLKKERNKLISMPIKGTIRRGVSPDEDVILKDLLHTSVKERAENMMIVDLVRNDLARSARSGSVVVEEMFGVYTFAALHQMISTVVAEIRPEVDTIEAIRNAFPMGSMTGAPKIKAMELIDQYEDLKRGLYSGAVGYFTPEGDFDFNVVIRSIQYDVTQHYLSFSVGSAITYDAIPEQEYAECLLKAQAMYTVLTAR
ncbi:anthranilate synthase component I family protein [Cytophagaceae bacterium YF14B1]|uniref:Anthranilate synthase component I family protein n=1 Tax=Xanthocytophaga flava TaxID=3048013 RepID=A0AAE3UBI8_9BACT|nr:anthranilate synthase component I family protein [Xanthocytophaga flavus]MDJ1485807.1 anthranilate synthase component I family protein [Xanthocytophaga flavus]